MSEEISSYDSDYWDRPSLSERIREKCSCSYLLIVLSVVLSVAGLAAAGITYFTEPALSSSSKYEIETSVSSWLSLYLLIASIVLPLIIWGFAILVEAAEKYIGNKTVDE